MTGAAGGLRLVVASEYLEAGANDAICEIHDARLAETRPHSEGTGRFLVLNTKTCSEETVESLVAETDG